MDELTDLELPGYSAVFHMALVYIAIGLALGFLEFTLAKAAFRNQPRRASILTRKMFVTCLLVNAAAWPGILVWLLLLGILKTTILVLERRKNR